MTDPQGQLDSDLTIDHEKFAGPVIKDPWDDDAQTDWPNNKLSDDEEITE